MDAEEWPLASPRSWEQRRPRDVLSQVVHRLNSAARTARLTTEQTESVDAFTSRVDRALRGGAIKSRPVKPSSPARSRRSELDLADIELAEMPRSVAVKPSSSPLGYTDSSDGGSDYSDLLSDGSESLRSELSSSSANISANISAVKPTSRVAHVDVQVRAPARIRHSAAGGARAPRRDADRARRDADARSDALLTV